MDRVRYVIVGLARSGTTATHAAIYGHPHICAMADELRVSPFFTSGVATFTVSGENQYERRIASDRIFDAITIYPPRAPDPRAGTWRRDRWRGSMSPAALSFQSRRWMSSSK